MVTWRRVGGPARRYRNRRRRLFVNSVLLLLLVLFGSGLLASSALGSRHTSAAANSDSTAIYAARTTTGCGKPAPFVAGTSQDTALVSGGLQRYYRLHLPAHYDSLHQYPLVLNFHGHGSSAAYQETYTAFSRLANADGFVVVYPQGVLGLDDKTGWSSGGVGKPRVDDVLFVNDLLNEVQSRLCIDPLRIYATGFSNGGGMTAVLACYLTNRIAAFASVSGSYYMPAGGCHPPRPTSILEIHGTDDHVVPFGGNPAIGLIGSNDWVLTWAARDGCATSPHITRQGYGVTIFTWTRCRNGATVLHYRISDGAHVWPGAPSLTASPSALSATKRVAPDDIQLNASRLIWSFFQSHPLSGVQLVKSTGANARQSGWFA